MTVIAVGHTHTKFNNLLKMIPEDFDVVKVFNGDDHREDGSIIVENDLEGRDVAMYATGFFDSGASKAVCLNDDVQHLSEEFWKVARLFLNCWETPPDIVGVTNLSSWVDYDKLGAKAKACALRQGRETLFIRTSAFMCTNTYFRDLYVETKGNAQAFEKGTLNTAKQAYIIPPQWAYDSNIEEYV